MLFEDEHVGIFNVLMLIPKQKKIRQLPAIIGLHGHHNSSWIFRDNYMGIDLVREGFIVIMPCFRAMSRKDTDVSKKLYLNGFTLMGIRVYETLLLIKYLNYIGEVDNEKIGIISHSGGGAVANLVVRLTDAINAQVTDTSSDYLDDHFHCETIPNLSYYHKTINDIDSLNIPVLQVSYGYPGDKIRQEIIEFFITNLEK